MTREGKQQISNIDFLRGIAAIAVLIWHYQHFYFASSTENNIGNERSAQPFFSALKFFYLNGHLAVQFFWILSGFVFFHVYKAQPEISARSFFAHRFARLYPLHLITLCSVAMLQMLSTRLTGSYQIYPFNDMKHFVLNLFFASHWGLQDGFSFNAPVWSVSVEVVIYVVFFVVLRFLSLRVINCGLWMIISHELRKHSPNPIFECSELFAIGGLLNLFSDTLESLSNKWVSIAVPVFALALFSVLVIGGRMASVEAVTFFGFPTIILVAVVSERRWYSLGKIGDFFGNITYSSYLIHVPIQIAAMLVMDAVFKSRDMVATRPFFLGYLAFVVAAAYFVYTKIEFPLKKKMLALIER